MTEEYEDDTHDQLTQAYLEYFKAYEWWETKRSVRAYYATQKQLKRIKKLARQLEKENTDIFRRVQNRPGYKKPDTN